MSKFDAAKALEKRVILLSGTDEALVREALKEVVAAAGLNDGDMDIESFAADARQPIDWIGCASSVPFLGDWRMVVVRNIGRVSPAKQWSEKVSKTHSFVKELSSLPEYGRMILVSDQEQGDTSKQDQVKSATEQWKKLVEHAGGAVFSFEPDPAKAVDQIIEFVKGKGKKISRPAATKISEMLGGQVGHAQSELEKVLIYIGDAPEVREADIELLVTPETDYNVFQLADAVCQGDAGLALKQMALLTERHPRLEQEVFPRVFPILIRQFRLLYQARVFVDARCHPANPTAEVRAQMPEKPNILTEREWLQKKMMGNAQRIPLKRISKCLEEIQTADAKLKGMAPAFSTTETLETLILNLSRLCSPA